MLLAQLPTAALTTHHPPPTTQASDGTFGKIISGSALVSIFGTLVAAYLYYGGDGLMAATAKQRGLSGMDGGSRQAGAAVCMTTDCMDEPGAQ